MRIITNVVNKVQDLFEHISGIESAPHLEDTPGSLDTMLLPCVLTDVIRGSEWGLDTDEGMVKLRLTSTVYLQSFAQEYLGVIKWNIHALADAIRDTFRDDAINYLYNDGTKMLLDGNEQQAWIAQGSKMAFSGYTRLEYPLGSQKFYHGFTVTFGVTGDDIACGEEDNIT